MAGGAKGTVLGVFVFTVDPAGAEEWGEWLITPDTLRAFLVRLLELCPISSGVHKGISTLIFSWAGLKYILSLFLTGCGNGYRGTFNCPYIRCGWVSVSLKTVLSRYNS